MLSHCSGARGSTSQTGTNIRKKISYNLGHQPGGVCALNDGMVEIIRVTFVLILQRVEEVEDIKGERC